MIRYKYFVSILILCKYCFEEEKKRLERKESWQNYFGSYLFPVVLYFHSATLLSRQSERNK
jgi:hypothetical protein